MLKNVPTIGGGQATRTWVSGVGDDANPCSRTAPCKTFAGAISKTALGGEIDALDPGGFGAVTITKSITIDGTGTFASILASGTNGINIAAGPNDIVTIRNLSINGNGTGLNGIHFTSGFGLNIENCVIFGFTQRGIFFEPTTTSRLFIKDTIIRKCNDSTNGGAVLVQPQGSAIVNATADNLRAEECLFGLSVTDRVVATIRNSFITGCSFAGVIAKAPLNSPAVLNVDTCSLVENNAAAGTFGALAAAQQAVVRLTNTTIMENGIGIGTLGNGVIVSFGNNRIAHNLTNGVPNSTEGPA